MDQGKRPRSPLPPPFVKDYRPYTGRQLFQRPPIVEDLKQDTHKSNWDLYYRNNTVNGFKDRNYILREFVELREAIMAANTPDPAATCSDMELCLCTRVASGSHSHEKPNIKPFSWLEAGCGVGNAMLPIFKQYGHLPHWRSLLGFDISKVAIKLLNEKKASLPSLLQGKLHVCVLNPCEQRIAGSIFSPSSGSVHGSAVEFVSMIFVLSSIPVPLHATALKHIAECMVHPGGVFFFRDYARCDLAEKRFRSRRKGITESVRDGKNHVADKFSEANESNIFARTNGTLTHFFSKDELEKLFTSVGFSVIEIREVDRETKNHKVALRLSPLCTVMGVHGLWRLLDTFGVVTQPEVWSGCRVAIDASIWIAQFRSQASSGDADKKIIQGFFLRILKLLFYGIEPVFVFDGPTSALKAKEHRRRQTLRIVLERSLLKRRAQQIVSALFASGHLDVANLKRKRENSEELTEAREAQDSELGMKSDDVTPSLTDDPQTSCPKASFAHEEHESVSIGNLGNILEFRNKHRHEKRRRLAPAEFSEATMLSFLKEAEGLVEQRKKGEQCVLNNTLRYSSSSLFMGPRCALLSESKKNSPDVFKVLDPASPCIVGVDGVNPQPYRSGVVLIDTDEDSLEATSTALTISSSQERSCDEALVTQPPADSSVCEEQNELCYVSDSSSQRQFHHETFMRSPVRESPDALQLQKQPEVVWERKVSPLARFTRWDSPTSSETLSDSSTSICSSARAFRNDVFTSTQKGESERQATGFLWEPTTQRQNERLAVLAERPSQRAVAALGEKEEKEEEEVRVRVKAREEKGEVGTTTATATAGAGQSRGLPSFVPKARVVRRSESFSAAPHGSCHLPADVSLAGGDSSGRSRQTVPFELLGIVNLLMCFQIPYIISPSEADAQCAYLARNGLVDAVFTEDSDVIVHGAPVILRGFFSSNKSVVAYRQAELEACGIDKRVLVALALLMGCDYTEGISGLGLSGALEALVSSWPPVGQNGEQKKNNPDEEMGFIIHVLSRWKSLLKKMPTSWADAGDSDLSLLQLQIFQKNKLSWRCLHLPEAFPEYDVAEAFYDAPVEVDRRHFITSSPQWQQVRHFAAENGLLETSWMRQRLELVQKSWCRRKEQDAVLTKSVDSRARQRYLEEFGMKTKIGEQWAYKKQPLRLSTVLAQLRDIKKLHVDID